MESLQSIAFQALTPEEALTLVAVMRRIVPHTHPTLIEAIWLTAQSYDARLVDQVFLRQEVRSKLRELNLHSQKTFGHAFSDLEPDQQDTLLRGIEDTPFFQNLINATISDFYNRHAVWEVIGYPGLEQRDGAGYLSKGFDHLPWD
ncbi:gluconate 2-dehydrogenase subunit 3 family protein [Kyrpidia sp.]|uniref:gluconate 2-dehydrogenase subunit 3 family protein n=1 Tax=Kyrpidia sp. TaxID=2073077 RepID=UPI0017AD9F9C|nr:gluconate 2-dehydrogenase subunit 3 family protein [Kyrpidia sp.]MCL6576770.1 gluconate 2-dehydrogenase subunit 3 family protein [Kyrpidia sp.]HHY66940.1 gluconate 2-dehydrogenase subunit 3 family protein [Alicyclobacillus sp.]